MTSTGTSGSTYEHVWPSRPPHPHCWLLRRKQALWGGAFCLHSRCSPLGAGHREPCPQPGTPGRGPLAHLLLCPDWPGNPGLVGERLHGDLGPHLCSSSCARALAVAAGAFPLPAPSALPAFSLEPRWGDFERPAQAFLRGLLRCGCHLGRALLVQAASLRGQVLAVGVRSTVWTMGLPVHAHRMPAPQQTLPGSPESPGPLNSRASCGHVTEWRLCALPPRVPADTPIQVGRLTPEAGTEPPERSLPARFQPGKPRSRPPAG